MGGARPIPPPSCIDGYHQTLGTEKCVPKTRLADGYSLHAATLSLLPRVRQHARSHSAGSRPVEGLARASSRCFIHHGGRPYHVRRE
jgi:hypothetical protein